MVVDVKFEDVREGDLVTLSYQGHELPKFTGTDEAIMAAFGEGYDLRESLRAVYGLGVEKGRAER